MLKLPKVSEIKFPKLIIHSIFVVVTLTVLILFSKDLVGLSIGHPIEKDFRYISTVLFIIWLLFALQNGKYQKQNNNC